VSIHGIKRINKTYLPLLYTPLDVNNPVLYTSIEVPASVYYVLKEGVDGVKIYINILDKEKLDNNYIEAFHDLIKSFVNELKKELDKIRIEVCIEISKNLYGLGLFVAVTQELLRLLNLDPEEALFVANEIDESMGLGNTIIRGLRRAYSFKKCIVYRDNEQPIILDLEIPVRIYGFVKKKIKALRMLDEQAIRTSIIHLGGYTVLSITKCLLSSTNYRECLDLFNEAFAIINGLQYILHDIYPANNKVLVEDINGYLAIVEVG